MHLCIPICNYNYITNIGFFKANLHFFAFFELIFLIKKEQLIDNTLSFDF